MDGAIAAPSGFCAKTQVSGITEAGNDVGLAGHLTVYRADPQTRLRQVCFDVFYPFFRGDNCHNVQLVDVIGIQQVFAGKYHAATGSQHRVGDNDRTVIQVGARLIFFMKFENAAFFHLTVGGNKG